jgi:hypothetical protein
MTPAKKIHWTLLATLLLTVVILISSFRQESTPTNLWCCFSTITVGNHEYYTVRIVRAKTKKDAERIFDNLINSDKDTKGRIDKDKNAYRVRAITADWIFD